MATLYSSLRDNITKLYWRRGSRSAFDAHSYSSCFWQSPQRGRKPSLWTRWPGNGYHSSSTTIIRRPHLWFRHQQWRTRSITIVEKRVQTCSVDNSRRAHLPNQRQMPKTQWRTLDQTRCRKSTKPSTFASTSQTPTIWYFQKLKLQSSVRLISSLEKSRDWCC